MRFLGKHVRIAIAALGLAALAVPVVAQTPSLGDIAKKEQERRKGSKQPAKVYTNDDLKGGGQSSAPPAPESHATEAAAPAGPADAPPAQAAADPPKDGKPAAAKEAPGAADAKDEEAWRGRITQARDELRRNEVFAQALQSRINALTTDFAARDNPVERAQIADERQKALAELERVKGEIEKSKKQIVDIEEDARKAGVPPGWLR
jgi:hypothetical protein